MMASKMASQEKQAQKREVLDVLGKLLFSDPGVFFDLLCSSTEVFPMEIGEDTKNRLIELGLLDDRGVPAPIVVNTVQKIIYG